VWLIDDALQPVAVSEAGQIYKWRYRGNRRYELCNHLGNVQVVITDKKIPYDDGTRWKYYTADVVSTQDYYAFGQGIEERGFSRSNSKYRYSYNGKETDDETGIQDYGFRMYDSRLCRFLSVDPLAPKYPELTTYQFASNTPIAAVDLDGLERYLAIEFYDKNKNLYKTLIHTIKEQGSIIEDLNAVHINPDKTTTSWDGNRYPVMIVKQYEGVEELSVQGTENLSARQLGLLNTKPVENSSENGNAVNISSTAGYSFKFLQNGTVSTYGSPKIEDLPLRKVEVSIPKIEVPTLKFENYILEVYTHRFNEKAMTNDTYVNAIKSKLNKIPELVLTIQGTERFQKKMTDILINRYKFDPSRISIGVPIVVTNDSGGNAVSLGVVREKQVGVSVDLERARQEAKQIQATVRQ
jgi:RHS repeat-associated protein